jgi:hypothetical protein
MTAPRVLRLKFTKDEWEKVSRPAPAERAGGMQSLIRKIKSRTSAKLEVDLLPQDYERAKVYANYQGGGGYEIRFAAVVEAARRAEREAGQ